MEKENCIICNSLFEKTRPNKICCSINCRQKKYRLNHNELIKIKSKLWRDEHPNYNSKYKKQWRMENPNYDNNYYNKNQKQILERVKKNYRDNKNKKLKYQNNYYKNNKKEILKKMKQYREDFKDLIKERKNKDYINNKERYNERSKLNYHNKYKLDPNYKKYRNEYEVNKRKTDELYYLKHIVRSRLAKFLNISKFNKISSTFKMIGCTPQELKDHLEKQFVDNMNWDNRGQWHIDHIKPLASAESEEDLINLCHYTNLQPLWAEDNLKKGAIY